MQDWEIVHQKATGSRTKEEQIWGRAEGTAGKGGE